MFPKPILRPPAIPIVTKPFASPQLGVGGIASPCARPATLPVVVKNKKPAR